MKKFYPLAAAAALTLSLPAYAETPMENEREIQEGTREIRQDNAGIAQERRELERHRAKKAAAKANKDYGTQAKESLAIGAKHAKIGVRKADRAIDRELLKKDKRDRADYDRRDVRGYNESNPSAGKMERYYGPGRDIYGNPRNSQFPTTHKDGPVAKL